MNNILLGLLGIVISAITPMILFYIVIKIFPDYKDKK